MVTITPISFKSLIMVSISAILFGMQYASDLLTWLREQNSGEEEFPVLPLGLSCSNGP